MKNKAVKITFIILVTILLFVIGITIWINTSTYKAAQSIAYEVALTDNVYYDVTPAYYKFGNLSEIANSEYGFIFYPGGLVEAESYSPLCIELSRRGYNCFISIMPLNLAILDINAADKIIDKNNKINKWIIGGHSLGGVMACRYLNSHDKTKVVALYLLASYCDQEIMNKSTKVLSVIGSEDKVLNINSYNDSKKNLPVNTKFDIIQGGNHSKFGNYGQQKGDGESTIDQKEQTTETVKLILDLLK